MNKYNLYSYSSSSIAHSYEWHLPKVNEVIKQSNAKTIFEVGCGNGSLGKIIMSNFKVDYFGMDYSLEGIKRSKEGGFESNFLMGDVSDENVSTGSKYDLCISVDVIEHIVDLSGYLNFIKSHLKPQGVVFISTTYHSYLKWLLLAIMGRMSSHVDPLWSGGRCKFFSKQQLTKLFHKHGFITEISTGGLNIMPSSFYITAKLGKK